MSAFVDFINDEFGELTAEINRLRAEVATLRALLAEAEWKGEDGMSCLYCEAVKSVGHFPDCRLKSALTS